MAKEACRWGKGAGKGAGGCGGGGGGGTNGVLQLIDCLNFVSFTPISDGSNG